MEDTKCNYQRKVTEGELVTALSEERCRDCGASVKELIESGEFLEVCGEEFYSDIVTKERVLHPVALCPECHRRNHLDAAGQHNPCQVRARLSREGLA